MEKGLLSEFENEKGDGQEMVRMRLGRNWGDVRLGMQDHAGPKRKKGSDAENTKIPNTRSAGKRGERG